MAVHLITGYKGTEHIQSKDARSFNAAMFGSGEFVMEIGNQLEGSIINNNTVRVLDGDILMQGGHIRIETDTYEDLTITTGTAGKNRNDLIVMTYEKNASDGTETAYLEVLQGTEAEGTASDPGYIVGTLAEGDLKNQMPLYRVKLEGVVLSDIETLFSTIPTYKTLAEQYAAQFQAACNTYLGALNILDTKEEIDANTLPNQLAGALGVKGAISQINSSLSDNVANETFNFGSLNGVRGFFTNPSRADDCFIPFKSGATLGTTIYFTSAQSPIIDFTATDDCLFVMLTYAQNFYNTSIEAELIANICSTQSQTYPIYARVYKVKKGQRIWADNYLPDGNYFYSIIGIEIK